MQTAKTLLYCFIIAIVIFSSVALKDDPDDDDDDEDEEEYGWGGNVTLPNDHSGQWNYRHTNVTILNSRRAGTGLQWRSQGLSGQQNTSYVSDLIIGAAYAKSGEQGPTNYVSYFDASGFADNGTETNYNISFSSAFIATTYISLVEKYPNGTVAQVIKFNRLDWTLSKHYVPQTGLNIVTIKGNSSTLGKFHVYFTFAVSSVVGVLNTTDNSTIVTPKSLETIVQIAGHRYLSPENTLTLEMVIGSGAATFENNGTFVIYKVGTHLNNTVFFILTSKVLVNGTAATVVISNFTKAVSVEDAFEDDDIIEDIIEEVYETTAQAHYVGITFPAGADNILYDPTTGAGVPIQAVTPYVPQPGVPTPSGNSGRTWPLWWIAIIIAVIVVVIAVIIAVVVFSRRIKYTSV
eukprot:TRINITY_DN13911_c0_g1_i1.p1 TRINITY_DN13911_c0_g1~~TRINITY_DN13911_c0_g1_i1.p1  ORF type:complete len:421 (+),score=80.29 TRINITY_DN13911_c0_g1_i1:47-1264(+)